MGETRTRSDAASGSRSRTKSTTAPRNFACQRDGCNKRFTRAEHLQRHALNHTDGEATCPRCRAHFKRPDLLDRHLQRHRQRDEEVGGEGHGVLNTRKRCWKAFDGSVVAKKPALGPRSPPEPYTQVQPQPDTHRGAADTSGVTYTESSAISDNSSRSGTLADVIYAAEVAPISPPHTSSSHSDPGRQLSAEAETYADTTLASFEQDLAPVASLSAIEQGFPPQGGSAWIASVATLPVPSCSLRAPSQQPLDFPYDDVFQADTSSSFNMPYTTAVNYNWLFNMDDTYDSGLTCSDLQQMQLDMQPEHNQQDLQLPQQQQQQQQLQKHREAPPDEFPISPSSQTLVSGHSQDGFETAGSTRADLTPQSHSALAEYTHLSAPMLETLSNVASRQQMYHSPQAHQQHHQIHQSNQHCQSPPHHLTKAAAAVPELERPLSSIKPPTNLPVIDHETRELLLEVIDSCQPVLPGGSGSRSSSGTWDDPLLATASLQEFCDLYFTRFNTAYPLLHQATFRPAQTEPLLLLAVLLLGATYSGKDAHQLAVCIHDVMRPRIFAHADFSAKPDLWVLQTILLVECFGKSRAGQKQHDMSHLFHGLLINLIRRSDCQSARPTIPDWGSPPHPSGASDTSTNSGLEDAWRTWAVQEEMKRLALLCFMWDTQHAVLFCQSLCMSAFELRLSMPCSQVLWEAPGAPAWKAVAQQAGPSQETLFLAGLKAYLTPAGPRARSMLHLNALSRVLILHGLLSISWDMERRDQTSLGVVSNFVGGHGGGGGGGSWRDRMSEAYDRWKGDFDAYCMDVAVHQRQQSASAAAGQQVDPSNPGSGGSTAAAEAAASREFATFSTAYNAIYHAAHVLLHADFLDIQIYAGARHILGRPVQRVDYLRSERVVKRWAAASSAEGGGGGGGGGAGEASAASAAKAAWHAACLLHDASHNLDDFDAMGLFHVPWCLYLATLTCWVFHHTRVGGNGGDDDGDSEIVWDARKEMDALVSSMAGTKPWNLMRAAQGKRKTGGLVWVMANVLSNVRWGIVHSGVIVLRGLVPSRMINQYEPY